MANRRRWVFAAVALAFSASSALAGSYRTTNFVVTAPTNELAQQFGEAAEYYRKEKAIEWLGQEMPNWQRPCPLEVRITQDGPSGATTFNFDSKPLFQHMKINGPKERLLNSVLPHEVTHTVFAYYFQRPVPRWADEGGAVLSEDDIERRRHDQMCRQLLNQGRAMKLDYLLKLSEYPDDVMVLYAEGFSIARYLVDQSDRATFLKFVQHGMSRGWNEAATTYYKVANVNALEAAWIDSLRKGRSPTAVVATTPKTTPKARAQQGELTGRSLRTTDPPAYPDLSPANARGTGAVLGAPGEKFGSPAISQPSNRPRYLPDLDGPPEPPIPAPPPPIPLPLQPARLGTPSLR